MSSSTACFSFLKLSEAVMFLLLQLVAKTTAHLLVDSCLQIIHCMSSDLQDHKVPYSMKVL